MKVSKANLEAAADYRPFERIGGYDGPVAMFYGDRDPAVPGEYAQRYRDACAGHDWGSVTVREQLFEETVTLLTGHADLS